MQKLNIQISQSLDELKCQLIDDINSHKTNVFQTTYIITTAQGVNNWLTENIAEENKIFANFKYTTVESVFMDVYRTLPGNENVKFISQQGLVWWIYAILKNTKSCSDSINGYFEKQPISCCMMIADLFDQYQIHRYEMLEKWTDKKDYFDSSKVLDENQRKIAETDEIWQKDLWQQLLKNVNERNENREQGSPIVQLPFQLYQNLKKVDSSNFGKIKEKIPALYLFNHFGVSRTHVEIFQKIAKELPVYVYYKDVRYKELEDWSDMPQKVIGLWEEGYQYDENNFKSIDPEKLSLHSNFSIKREVETWYNYLVDHSNDIAARKIWVTVPDIKTYSPYIRAVMDNAPVKVHYTIADEVNTITDEALNLFRFMLELDYDRINVEQLIQLINFEIIQQKFGINDTEFVIESLLAAKVKRRFSFGDDDASEIYSINTGIKRLILGLFTSENEPIEGKYYPVVTSEEFNTQQNIVALAQLVDELEKLLSETKKTKSLAEWGNFIESQIVLPFIERMQDKGTNGFLKIRSAISNLRNNSSDISEINYKDIRSYLLGMIEDEDASTQYMNTGITFSSMLPYRGLPFDMIAVFGMDSTFPRVHTKNAYDLMRYENISGDRVVTENDLQVMLEMMDNAQKQLFISYIGRSQTTLKKLFPSSVISRLFSNYEETQTKHRLTKDDFNEHYHRIGNEEVQISKERDKTTHKEYTFTLRDVLSFYNDSVKFYYQKMKGLYLFEDEKIDIYESFETGPLENWSLNDDLLTRFLKGEITTDDDFNAFEEEQKLKGNLGLNSESSIKEVRDFYNNIKTNITERTLEKVKINLGNINDILIDGISGYLDKNDSTQYYFISPSKDKNKRRLEAFTNACILSKGLDKTIQLHYSTKGGKYKNYEIHVNVANDVLETLFTTFKEKNKILFPFLIEYTEFDQSRISGNESLKSYVISQSCNYDSCALKNRSIYTRRFEGLYNFAELDFKHSLETLNTLNSFLSNFNPTN